MHRLRLPENLRRRLKTPLGELIPGPPKSSLVRLNQILDATKPPKVICVGDFVSRLLTESSTPVDLTIIDNKVMRQETKVVPSKKKSLFRVANLPGTIECAAWTAVDEALKKPNSVLIVDGEEDLLTLVAISLAPENSLIVYGQPSEGMVAVRANKEKKSEVESIIAQMTKE